MPRRINSLRGFHPWADNARKVMCIYGHPFDEANTYKRHEKGKLPSRQCRACNRGAVERCKQRKAARA